MKEIFIILAVFFSSLIFSQKELYLEKRLINLEKSIKELDSIKKDFYYRKDSKYEFDIKDWDKKVKSLIPKSKTDWNDFWIPFLSLFIPIATAIVAGFIAIHQTNKNGKWALKQSRANTIASARIEWMQKLRSNLSEFIALVESINYYLIDVIRLKNEKNDLEARKLYDQQIKDMVKMRAISTEIKLQLNVKEKEHLAMDNAIDDYINHALEELKKLKDEKGLKSKAQRVLDTSRIVLKNVWEQAKKDGGNTV